MANLSEVIAKRVSDRVAREGIQGCDESTVQAVFAGREGPFLSRESPAWKAIEAELCELGFLP